MRAIIRSSDQPAKAYCSVATDFDPPLRAAIGRCGGHLGRYGLASESPSESIELDETQVTPAGRDDREILGGLADGV